MTRRRLALIAAGSALALLAAGGITWRVLKPTEVVTAAVEPYPSRTVHPVTGPRGALINSPLIVGDRLRVYAAKRQVWADDQPGYRWETTPFWSYRRWPATVAAVVAPPGQNPLVVTLWSDGRLIGLDGRTGTVAWQVSSDLSVRPADGRRTGSALVWEQQQLRTGLTLDGRPVIVAVDGTSVRGFSAVDGRRLWSQPVVGACGGGDLTAPGAYVSLDNCNGELLRIDLATGTVERTPAGGRRVDGLGCRVGRSECLGLRISDGVPPYAAVFAGAASVPAPFLASGTAWLAVTASGRLVAVDPTLTGRDPRTGEALWTWRPGRVSDTSPAAVIATAPGRILLLTRHRTLIALDPADGVELSRSPLLLQHDRGADYAVGRVYTSGRYIAIERIVPGSSHNSPDGAYYFTNRPVLLAAS